MAVVDLTPYREIDLALSRGETAAFRLTFTDLSDEQFAEATFSADIRRAAALEPIAAWSVSKDLNTYAVTCSLTAAVSETLPERCVYAVRITYGASRRVPMGGRLNLRLRSC